MTKAEFNRELPGGFVAALNTAYAAENRWWRNLADDPDIFIAVRGGYLNAYYKGSSLMRLTLPKGELCGSVHYKYLLKPSHRPEYTKIVAGRPDITDPGELFLSDLSDVASLKRAAEPYAGLEKIGVHGIIKSNPNIVDVEIAFGAGGSADGKATAPRMDFAALRRTGDEVRLTFFEAKHFSNQELRASGEVEAKVVAQINGYGALLSARRDDVCAAYRKAFSYLLDMDGKSIRKPVRDELMALVVSGKLPLVIDCEPRLVIFGFDADQKGGSVWGLHLDKLKAALPGRVLVKGASDGFKTGIST
ncbi:hypothetical protein [Amorphus coralli]|uniref:hypothetical protein n=1 Tax=Amorphus coralli TaxID=340680 RepID=UPI001AEBFA10|nr:hypothetical protein [Amorphus coralli]